MRLSKEDKARNRDNIVESAGRMFRTRGVDGVGIVDLMKSAGLTHGGFYNHFPSKDALAAEVCRASFERTLGMLAAGFDDGSDESGTALNHLLDDYLSAEHRDSPDGGCPSASLVVDAWRQDDQIQEAYAEGVEGYLTTLAAELSREAAREGEGLDPAEARDRAVRLLSEMVGAMVLARAVGRVAPSLSDEILDAGRRR
jgi:TetR/AcrR family transcriptional regulator, transcriptional repressor for nem operon